MRRSLHQLTAFTLFSLLALAPAAVGGQLADAYQAILKGDYETGQREITQVADESPQALAVSNWLERYQDMLQERRELRRSTFDWNYEKAQKSLREDKLYRALSFAAQAAPYADDEDRYANDPWIQNLRGETLEAARKLEQRGEWAKAHSHYVMLRRINEDDEQAESLRERAARYVRIEVLYEDQEAVQRRMEGVDVSMLHQALRNIDTSYYRDPDFKKMADGGIDNLITLARCEKIYDASDVFNGIATQVPRETFVSDLERMQTRMHRRDTFGYRDVIGLFRQIESANRQTVELPREILVVEFLEGAIDELDNFTTVIWPSDVAEFQKQIMGNFKGVGIQLGVDELTNRLKVITPLENSPALEAGVEPDDLIIGVDGESTRGWSTMDAVREITGPAGTKVTLTLFRPRLNKKLDVELTRREIVIKTVRGYKRTDSSGDHWNYMLDDDAGIAYIQLTGFTRDSHRELMESLIEAQRQGMNGLILDLRNNPGGLLDVAIHTVSTFLRRGKVVETAGRYETRQRLRTTGRAMFEDLPLMVLVNDGSASASEILAGALQDHNRAVVLGDRTYGKGSVQRVLSLPGDAQLKLTTALYYLPSGRTPHKAPEADEWGVDPDTKVELFPKEFAKVLERERDTYIIHNEKEPEAAADEEAREAELAKLRDNGEDEDGDQPLLSEDDIALLRSDPNEAPMVDPQLETALLHMRVKLAGNLRWPREVAAADRR